MEMAKRFEALQNDVKIGSAFVEQHEAAILAAFERLSVHGQMGAFDVATFCVRKAGQYAFDAARAGTGDRDDLFLFGLTCEFETIREWEWDGDLVAAANAL